MQILASSEEKNIFLRDYFRDFFQASLLTGSNRYGLVNKWISDEKLSILKKIIILALIWLFLGAIK